MRPPVCINEDLSFETVPDLCARSRAWFTTADEGVLEIDLAQIERADSAGIALLVQWMEQAEHHKIELRYQNVPGQLASLIRANGLAALFPL